MEIPIKVIITLFVAVVAAIIIVQFATDQIDDAKAQLNELGAKGETDEDIILEMPRISSHQIALMADNCYVKYSNKEIENKLCFVLLGEVDASEGSIEDESNYPDNLEIDLGSADNAVKIKYNPALDKVEIGG